MSNALRDYSAGCRQIAADLMSGWRAFGAYDLLCKLISLAIFAPLSTWVLRAMLQWSGDQVVSNFDLVSFFLSPQGLLLIVVWATGSILVLFLELGGLTLLAIGVQTGKHVSVPRTLQILSGRFLGLLLLGLRQFLTLGAIMAAFLVVALVTKATLLSGGDIYFYLNVRPPEYWWAAGVLAVAGLAAAIATTALLLRWLFAVPVLLIEGKDAAAAMRESHRLLQMTGGRKVILCIGSWAGAMLLILVLGGLTHSLFRALLMGIAGENVSSVIAAAGLLLATDFLLAVLLGMISAISFAAVLGRLYLEAQPGPHISGIPVLCGANERSDPRFPVGRSVFAAALVLVGFASVLSYSIIDRIHLDDDVAVTAHRGSARAAPENTMAALQRAIRDDADFAEIDVQETEDGVIVLLHDTDLRRVAGVDRNVWEVTWDEIRELDVGSWFSDEFASERVVTLAEAMEAARGRIRLNIELKLHGHNRALEAEVVRIVRDASFGDECIVTSLDYGAIQEVARHDNRLRRGLIVTAAIGDPTAVDADVLAVNAQTVTRDLIARAHEAGMEVHVWTVNDPEQMLTMIHLGVDNILTSSPDILVELIREREAMSDAEKTLLFVSDFLAGRL